MAPPPVATHTPPWTARLVGPTQHHCEQTGCDRRAMVSGNGLVDGANRGGCRTPQLRLHPSGGKFGIVQASQCVGEVKGSIKWRAEEPDQDHVQQFGSGSLTVLSVRLPKNVHSHDILYRGEEGPACSSPVQYSVGQCDQVHTGNGNI